MYTAQQEVVPQNSFAAVMRYLPLLLFLFVSYLVWEFFNTQQRRAIPLTCQVGIIVGFSLLLGVAYHVALPTGLLKNDAAKSVIGRFHGRSRKTEKAPGLSYGATDKAHRSFAPLNTYFAGCLPRSIPDRRSVRRASSPLPFPLPL